MMCGEIITGYYTIIIFVFNLKENDTTLNAPFNFIFQFSTDKKLSEDDEFYNPNPKITERVHVLVCVIPANNMAIMTNQILEKIRKIRLEARDLSKFRNLFDCDFIKELLSDLFSLFSSVMVRD